MGMGLHLGYEGLKTGLRQAYEGGKAPSWDCILQTRGHYYCYLLVSA